MQAIAEVLRVCVLNFFFLIIKKIKVCVKITVIYETTVRLAAAVVTMYEM